MSLQVPPYGSIIILAKSQILENEGSAHYTSVRKEFSAHPALPCATLRELGIGGVTLTPSSLNHAGTRGGGHRRFCDHQGPRIEA